MKASITLTVEVDVGLVEQTARLRGRSPADVFAEVVGDLECRLFDSCRWRHGVVSVASRVVTDTPAQELVNS